MLAYVGCGTDRTQCVFFFSSRRRHTRSDRDWSSDVCSSDLATTPSEIHTLELAATHGRDHSSHMFVASFALWAEARTGYDGPVTWHRGYNVGEIGRAHV